MKCKQCGAENGAEAAFCQACGAALSAPGKPAVAAKSRMSSAGSRREAPNDPEVVLWEGRYSKLAMVGPWVAAGVMAFAALVVGALFSVSSQGWTIILAAVAVVWAYYLLKLLYMKATLRYTLTNQRFVHERGLLWRQIDRIETIDIDDVTVSQGPIDRMFGVGTIRLVSSDQTNPKYFIVGIEDVRRVATMIDDARREERRKRAVHIESF